MTQGLGATHFAAHCLELGFFSPSLSGSTNTGLSGSCYLAIWYDRVSHVPVWLANRHIPVTDSSGVVTMGSNGKLKINKVGITNLGQNHTICISGEWVGSVLETEGKVLSCLCLHEVSLMSSTIPVLASNANFETRGSNFTSDANTGDIYVLTLKNSTKEKFGFRKKKGQQLQLYSLPQIAATIKNFSINKKLGQGGFGEVYKTRDLWKKGISLELTDPVLSSQCPENELLQCIHVGLLCVQECAIDRHTVSDIICMLTNVTTILPDPKRPAFYTGRSGIQA
ncbi:Receptor-like serine/threonine-protein kinase SD1-7 [Camellia lanceoleosa]|uniref:Receptor-like serine/threonine-protein kinase SD1-7 n=1 Tax=Camellia lanceoleosa TaxID=1840588 RepID=A0ACC0ICW9_9ERIC|nr:Receptor-like serine/threonine-protein kinase SD1-7 [Camellia lanceoleosa]